MKQRVREAIKATASGLRARGRALALLGWAIAAIGFAVAVGVASRARADALAARAAELERSAGIMRSHVAQFTPATEAERRAWRQTERQLRELGVTNADRIAIARSVSERVELVGLPDARLTFGPPDQVTVTGRSGSNWTVAAGPFSLGLTVRTDLDGLIDLIGALPPQLRIQRVDIARSGSGAQASLLLSTYEVQLSEAVTLAQESAMDSADANP